MRREEYVLMEEYRHEMGTYDVRILPAGTFVQPIHRLYLPKHITEVKGFDWTLRQGMVFCYTRYGIIPIPKKIIRCANG